MENRLTVACVQAQSRNGRFEENLSGAEELVREAAGEGAKLLLCPEFLAAGYVYHSSIWESGERRGGPTETWLAQMARTHSVFIGASFLEAEGEDFFNTFTLAAPDGTVAGRVRKASLPAFEGWFFKADPGPKIIECDLGRIAVGICNDNATSCFWNGLCADRPDLVLMPHSAPTVGRSLAASVFSQAVCDNMASIGPHYARGFGVPVVVVNKPAVPPSPSPIPLLPALKLDFVFQGGSMICDGDGRVLAQLDDRPGTAVADVSLDPARKRRPRPVSEYWARPPGRWPKVGAWVWRVLELAGRTAYAVSGARRRAAIRRSREEKMSC